MTRLLTGQCQAPIGRRLRAAVCVRVRNVPALISPPLTGSWECAAWSLPSQSSDSFPCIPRPGTGVILHSLYRLRAGECWQALSSFRPLLLPLLLLPRFGDMEEYKVTLEGPAPWGFRLQGGKDFNMPLSISRLTPGGKAELAGVNVGDWLLQIEGDSTTSMTHIEAQNKIRASSNKLGLVLSRFAVGVNQAKGVHTPESQGRKYNFAPSTALNKIARPFGTGTPPPDNSRPGQLTKPVAYNPPPTSYTTSQTAQGQLQNGHSLRMETHPAFLANDSSKKRLMEDTQDWKPRTGTTQSRSFRILAQLTGTDFMQDPDDENMKRVRQESRTAFTVSGKDTTDHPIPPAPPSGPAARPPWTTDPTFADRYAPDKTTTVMTKHTQPATPTPAQSRNSILQAAQVPSSGDKTPVCCQCNKIIRGRFLLALGRYYHPEEFTCSQCHKVLEEGGFFEEKGSIFCPRCYDARFAPNCAKCKKKITGEIMHALKMTWHVPCFTCAYCKTPIRNRAFYMEDGKPYCEKDYEQMFGTKCRGCDFKIDAGDRFLEALGFSWHDTCFVCAICQMNLEGKTFYSKKDKPLCKTHAFSNV
uniref:PDZ and LIM domain protein 7 n=1 Tax=Xenopus tropicalis TaxID=8364 RepID=A0A803K843_XENTR